MSPMQVLAICLNKIAKINGEIEAIPAALVFKASIDNVDLLPTNPRVGDMYNITVKSIYGEPGMNVAWNGTEWDALGSTIDLSQYYTKTETDNKFSYKTSVKAVEGNTISMALTNNILYVFSELASLNITYTNPEDYVETPLDQSNVDAIKSLYAYNGVTLLNNNENTVMKVMYKSK